LGDEAIEYGYAYLPNLGAFDWAYDFNGPRFEKAIYGISSPITIEGAATPEPASTGLLAMGGAFLLLAGRRQQQSHKALR
jgi:hypothetical protein